MNGGRRLIRKIAEGRKSCSTPKERSAQLPASSTPMQRPPAQTRHHHATTLSTQQTPTRKSRRTRGEQPRGTAVPSPAHAAHRLRSARPFKPSAAPGRWRAPRALHVVVPARSYRVSVRHAYVAARKSCSTPKERSAQLPASSTPMQPPPAQTRHHHATTLSTQPTPTPK